MKGKLITSEDFLNRIKERFGDEYTFLDPYQGRQNEIRVRHNPCGYVCAVKPEVFLYYHHTCSRCAQRLANDKFIQRVKAKVGNEYTFLEPYVNWATEIKTRHNVCGRTYTVTPNNFLNTDFGRCPYCYPKKHAISNDEFLKRLKQKKGKEYVLLDQFHGLYTKIKVRHITCNTTYSVLPVTLLQSKGCPFCSGSWIGYRKTNADFLRQVKNQVGNEYTFLEPYKKAMTPIKVRHNNCGTIYLAVPNNFLQGHRCPYCNRQRHSRNILYTEETGWLKKGDDHG